ncbi:uncharacterized protein LOC129290282 [Prosopis cineraria]|uniref:uncharacterized protein LOC129290282 n=1 Tax=Prosopis cineraria TaxID=364024 RepID=UPI00240FD9C1|nr:uncharacterized protein LOC129290282 [Prosopis cineraria]
MMAIFCACSTQIPVQKSGSFLKIASKDLKSKRSSVPLKRTSFARRIRASIKNKVYEDLSEGIVCYRDENGEIICEGYDEGPRLQRTSKPPYHLRDVEIREILQQNWIKIVKGEEVNHPEDEGVLLQEDLNCNGFNSFC